MNLRSISNPEMTSNPISPAIGSSWVIASGRIGSPGLAMGVMGLTYTEPVVDTYTLKYKTVENTVVGVKLS